MPLLLNHEKVCLKQVCIPDNLQIVAFFFIINIVKEKRKHVGHMLV